MQFSKHVLTVQKNTHFLISLEDTNSPCNVPTQKKKGYNDRNVTSVAKKGVSRTNVFGIRIECDAALTGKRTPVATTFTSTTAVTVFVTSPLHEY